MMTISWHISAITVDKYIIYLKTPLHPYLGDTFILENLNLLWPIAYGWTVK